MSLKAFNCWYDDSPSLLPQTLLLKWEFQVKDWRLKAFNAWWFSVHQSGIPDVNSLCFTATAGTKWEEIT